MAMAITAKLLFFSFDLFQFGVSQPLLGRNQYFHRFTIRAPWQTCRDQTTIDTCRNKAALTKGSRRRTTDIALDTCQHLDLKY
ncbi:hypothetical protein EV356DRAFT_249364 [Viridothelium virens]|uniref:Secreted protein n=1 Tax=Viridothelium virens TaxID=1048519 RepID=A0A6A6H3V8_VIRVR|nr:hypothetical protein EV356DRAFT_249364 [Viridothelium virens]